MSNIPPSPSTEPEEYGGGMLEDRNGKLPSAITCKICNDEYDLWLHVHELFYCKHIYCIDCLRQYFTQRIKDGLVLNLPCPDPLCKEEVAPDDVRCVLGQEMWEKYDHLVLMTALKQDPNICWCPFPRCTNAIYRDPEEEPKMQCNACSYQFCAECSEAWHGDMSCEEHAKIKAKIESSAEKQIPLFNMWTNKRAKLVKPCPGCKAYIEKFDGCNHMTCMSCKYEFCWICLSEYVSGHYNDKEIFPNCYMKQYYSPAPWYKLDRETIVKLGKMIFIGVTVVCIGVPVAVVAGPIYCYCQLRQKVRSISMKYGLHHPGLIEGHAVLKHYDSDKPFQNDE
jgi:hypothetical protein